MPQKKGPKKLEQNRRRRRRIQLEVLEHYGGGQAVCVRCGFDDIRGLCLDHINGGGRLHFKVLGRQGCSFYGWLRTHGYPSGFQTLCANCNQIKKHEEKEFSSITKDTQVAFI